METTPAPLFFLGISGCPSSGKSTLAYLLTLIYSDSILLHADDFAKDEDVPMLPSPLNCPDSDSRFAVNYNAMCEVLDHIRTTGRLPGDYESWFQNVIMTIAEGQSRIRDSNVIGNEGVEDLARLLQQVMKPSSISTEKSRRPRLVILDGFLLYHDPEIRRRLDLMLFLRLSKATAKARRLAKPGWGKDAKHDMYWATEPYFEASVWKNYVQEHAWLFVNGDVEGELLNSVAAGERIETTPVLDWSLRETAQWAVELIGIALKSHQSTTPRTCGSFNLVPKHVLYLQAEILHLEAELHEIVIQDHYGCEKRQNYEHCVFDLKESYRIGGNDTQWRKILEIRDKLKEYNDAVLRFNQICRLPKANPSNLKFFRNWLDHDEGGHLFLQGREAWTWDPSHTEDITTVSGTSPNKDVLSQWINDRFVPWYHRNLGHRLNSDLEGNRLWVYPASTVAGIVSMMSTILAPLLPVISMFVLSAIQKPMARLYTIMAFTSIFSIALTVIAKPSRIENFAATIA